MHTFEDIHIRKKYQGIHFHSYIPTLQERSRRLERQTRGVLLINSRVSRRIQV